MKLARKAIKARKEQAQDQVQRATIKELVETIESYKARQPFIDSLKKVRAEPRIRSYKTPTGVRQMAAVALMSDLHIEEPVYPEQVAGKNEYNLEIADVRFKRFFDAIAWNLDHHRSDGTIEIKSLVLWLGGDLLSGYIHSELVESNLLSPTKACGWLLRRIRDGIHFLLAHGKLDKIVIPCSYGNHGRTTEKRRISTGADNSFEQMLYYFLAEMFVGDKRVQFEITDSAHQYVNVLGHDLHFTHGDELRFLGGVGGLAVPLGRRLPMWDRLRPCSVHNFGHFHQFRDFGRAVCNGSLIGYGAYSISIGADFEPPQQAFYLMDAKRGKNNVTALWVGE